MENLKKRIESSSRDRWHRPRFAYTNLKKRIERSYSLRSSATTWRCTNLKKRIESIHIHPRRRPDTVQESQKENWKTILTAFIFPYPLSAESQKENWKSCIPRIGACKSPSGRISKRELKVLPWPRLDSPLWPWISKRELKEEPAE